jgi:hypothetical protein
MAKEALLRETGATPTPTRNRQLGKITRKSKRMVIGPLGLEATPPPCRDAEHAHPLRQPFGCRLISSAIASGIERRWFKDNIYSKNLLKYEIVLLFLSLTYNVVE